MTASWPCPGTPHRGHTRDDEPCPLVPVEVEVHPPVSRWTTSDGHTVEVRPHPDAGLPNVHPDAQLVKVTPAQLVDDYLGVRPCVTVPCPDPVDPPDRSRWDPSPEVCYPDGPPRDPLAELRDRTTLTAAERARLATIRAELTWYRDDEAVAAARFLLDLVDRLTADPTTEE